MALLVPGGSINTMRKKDTVSPVFVLKFSPYSSSTVQEYRYPSLTILGTKLYLFLFAGLVPLNKVVQHFYFNLNVSPGFVDIVQR